MKEFGFRIIEKHEKLVNEVIDFFTSEETNPELYKAIQEICIKWANHFKTHNGENFIKSGYLSSSDFSQYVHETKRLNGVEIDLMEVILKLLIEERFIVPLPDMLAASSREKRFKANPYVSFFYKRKLVLNVIGGWKYIIDRYKNSVFKIEHKDKQGGYSIGTGFYYAGGDGKVIKAIIITNKHVVVNAESVKVLNKQDEVVEYISIVEDPMRDLAFIELKERLPINTFYFNPIHETLAEILTIGYPSIPMTKDSYQVYHKGEINSFVEDYQNNKLFLFSAKTSSGNSGSPIIDRFGMVSGIIAQEFFEEEQLYKKGKLPYYAGIPTSEIIKSVNDHVFNSNGSFLL